MIDNHLKIGLDLMFDAVQRGVAYNGEVQLIPSMVTPAMLLVKARCGCGGEHRVVIPRNSAGYEIPEGSDEAVGSYRLKLHYRDTPECAAIATLREVGEYFGVDINAWKNARAAKGHAITVDEKKHVYVGSVLPSEHIALRGTKKHRVVDVRKPHAGGPVVHKRKPNLTEAEIVAYHVLLTIEFPRYRYIIVRMGGTPDFFIYDTWNRTPSGILWREAKAGRDRLDEETQAECMLLAEYWGVDAKIMMTKEV